MNFDVLFLETCTESSKQAWYSCPPVPVSRSRGFWHHGHVASGIMVTWPPVQNCARIHSKRNRMRQSLITKVFWAKSISSHDVHSGRCQVPQATPTSITMKGKTYSSENTEHHQLIFFFSKSHLLQKPFLFFCDSYLQSLLLSGVCCWADVS